MSEQASAFLVDRIGRQQSITTEKALAKLTQEIAEYPLMFLWFARADGLLVNLDKWSVVEWPKNFQDGYDADVREGKLCTDMHNAINAWYIGAVKSLNAIAARIGRPPYADVAPLEQSFRQMPGCGFCAKVAREHSRAGAAIRSGTRPSSISQSRRLFSS